MGLIHGRWCMVAEHLQGDALLGHSHNRLFVHVRIVDAHAAEYGKCFHKILIVLGEVLKIRNNNKQWSYNGDNKTWYEFDVDQKCIELAQFISYCLQINSFRGNWFVMNKVRSKANYNELVHKALDQY